MSCRCKNTYEMSRLLCNDKAVKIERHVIEGCQCFRIHRILDAVGKPESNLRDASGTSSFGMVKVTSGVPCATASSNTTVLRPKRPNAGRTSTFSDVNRCGQILSGAESNVRETRAVLE